MGFYIYILRCADGSFYVGHTRNLEHRVWRHQSGQFGGYTATRLPVELVFCEEMMSVKEAFEREVQIKRWSRAKKLALIARDWALLSRLARNRSDQGRGSTGSP